MKSQNSTRWPDLHRAVVIPVVASAAPLELDLVTNAIDEIMLFFPVAIRFTWHTTADAPGAVVKLANANLSSSTFGGGFLNLHCKHERQENQTLYVTAEGAAPSTVNWQGGQYYG